MIQFSSRNNLLRSRKSTENSRVTYVELFFDLVFVFAVTQLSQALLKDSTFMGVAHSFLLFMAVWWVWVFTSWVTNWLDPQKTPVRLMLYALMFAGILLSISIPEAFGSHGLTFAVSYAFMQVGRSLFMCWALPHQKKNYKNFLRITVWLSLAAFIWIAGGLAQEGTRFALWGAALFLEYLSPTLGFWTPVLGSSTTADWDVSGAHMAERCGLFIIIAFGESILVAGVSFGKLAWSPLSMAAFLSTFASTVAMWWVYFDIGAERASRRIASSGDPGRFAHIAYSYIHILLVAGIIIEAVADELVLSNPGGHTDLRTALTVLGGPALFIFGNLLFKKVMFGKFAQSHITGIILLALLLPAYTRATPLMLNLAVTPIIAMVAALETISVTRKKQNPSPGSD
jgi:low temperature requirement protein LtrA